MKKADIYIIGAVLLSAIIGAEAVYINSANSASVHAEIYVSGELQHNIPLKPGLDDIVIENGEGGVNLIRIEDDGVYVAEANCKNQTCVLSGKLLRPGQIIACLPNRVLIKLAGSAAGGVDALAY